MRNSCENHFGVPTANANTAVIECETPYMRVVTTMTADEAGETSDSAD